jgi:hypothetical protein
MKIPKTTLFADQYENVFMMSCFRFLVDIHQAIIKKDLTTVYMPRDNQPGIIGDPEVMALPGRSHPISAFI